METKRTSPGADADSGEAVPHGTGVASIPTSRRSCPTSDTCTYHKGLEGSRRRLILQLLQSVSVLSSSQTYWYIDNFSLQTENVLFESVYV